MLPLPVRDFSFEGLSKRGPHTRHRVWIPNQECPWLSTCVCSVVFQVGT